jgi:hypothetical protein
MLPGLQSEAGAEGGVMLTREQLVELIADILDVHCEPSDDGKVSVDQAAEVIAAWMVRSKFVHVPSDSIPSAAPQTDLTEVLRPTLEAFRAAEATDHPECVRVQVQMQPREEPPIVRVAVQFTPPQEEPCVQQITAVKPAPAKGY